MSDFNSALRKIMHRRSLLSTPDFGSHPPVVRALETSSCSGHHEGRQRLSSPSYYQVSTRTSGSSRSRNRTLGYSGELESLGGYGMDHLELAVVIVTFNTRDLVLQCVRSVCADADRAGRSYRVIVVDNASTDGTAAAVRDVLPSVHLIENSANAGPAREINQGLLACADSDYVLL